MIKRYGILWLAGLVLLGSREGWAEQRLGVGVHYLTTVDDLDLGEGEDDGMSYVFSYQYRPSGLLAFELEVEKLPDDWLGSVDTLYAPKALLLVGSGIYAGAGIGTYYADGKFADDPFYLLRAGLNWPLLPSLSLDINLNYQFDEYEGIDAIEEDVGSDTITLGASARIAF